MKELLFRANGTELKIVDIPEGIVRGSHNYLNLLFKFGRDWANYKRVVQVKDVNGNEYNAVIRSGGVLLPQKITSTSRLYITVYGSNGRTTVKTNAVTIEQI